MEGLGGHGKGECLNQAIVHGPNLRCATSPTKSNVLRLPKP